MSVRNTTMVMVIWLLFWPTSLVAQSQKWTHSTSKDEMTGAIKGYAFSQERSPTKQLDPPYHDIKAQLAFSCDGQAERAYLVLKEAPNLTNASPDRGLNYFKARIRWDDNVTTIYMAHEWGSHVIRFNDFFGEEEEAISKIQTGATAVFELNWYGGAKLHLTFSLNGSANAIAAAREVCQK